MLLNRIWQVLILTALTVAFDPLVNTDSSPETLALYKQLTDNYDRYVFSGQTTFNYDDFVSRTGEHPMVRGFDMQNYSPHNPWFNWQPIDDGTVDKAIKWYLNDTNKQGIVIFFWHWFSPFGGQLRTSTFYTNYTDFDVSKAVTAGTEQYNATIRDLDAIAIQLKKLQQNKIPILWRPLHQAGGKWFWWGAKSNKDAKQLYRIMYDRYTNYHHIDNLVWVWSTPEPDWYPGNQLVDILGFDSYPGSYNYGCREDIYYQLVNLVQKHKMVYMTENGPIPNMQDCMRMGVKWGVFMTWNELTFTQNTIDHIKEVYSSAVVKKLAHQSSQKSIEQ